MSREKSILDLDRGGQEGDIGSHVHGIGSWTRVQQLVASSLSLRGRVAMRLSEPSDGATANLSINGRGYPRHWHVPRDNVGMHRND
jgi:hypothetical protein